MMLSRRGFCAGSLASLGVSALPGVAAVLGAKRWYKGMLHCHCYWSDGRGFPEQGAQAYYRHGYHFYAMTDHNRLGKRRDYWREVCEDEGNWPKNVHRPIFERYRRDFPDAEVRTVNGKQQVRIKTFDEIKAKFDRPGRFLVLPGMEITRTRSDAGHDHVHMNYINLDRGLATAEKGFLIQGYCKKISEIIGKSEAEVKALAAELGNPAHIFFVNHPQWPFWNVLPQDILDHPDIGFFEVCNCGAEHELPPCLPERHFSCDRLWDVVLAHRCQTGGKLLYGIGTDDAHWYPDSGTTQKSFPFADGYIQVRAAELSEEALMVAMQQGDFYASCGVDLEDVAVDRAHGSLAVSVPAKEGVSYTIRFVGTKRGFAEGVQRKIRFEGFKEGWRVDPRDYPVYDERIGVDFKVVRGKPGERLAASYTLAADDLYVRAIVESSERVVGYALTSKQHPKHKMAWTQPMRGRG